MYHRAFVLRGARPIEEWRDIVKQIVAAIGMTIAGEPAIYSYPNGDGQGGNGHSLFQPLTESFIALDTWTDHDGAYLFICSCKPFDRQPVFEVVRHRELGIDMEKSYELSLA